jgi:hypothetical protein
LDIVFDINNRAKPKGLLEKAERLFL